MSVRLPLVGVRLFRGGGEGEEMLMWAALLELLQKIKPSKNYPPEMGWGQFSSSSKLVFVTQLFSLKATYLDDRHVGVKREKKEKKNGDLKQWSK